MDIQDVVFYLVAGLLANVLIVQLIYQLFVFMRLAAAKSTPKNTGVQSLPVSLIVAARNELEHLQQHLPAWLAQEYPQFEVVVINDCSFDGSGHYLEEMEAKHPYLKVVTIREQEKYPTGKKFALTLGIKAAKYEHLIFTDADCMPASDKWLAYMASHFNSQKHLVLGYGKTAPGKGLVNVFSRWETFKTAQSYFSFALSGDPYMGVGRNLAYTKTLFFQNKGFASHAHVIAGDDDLFVNENATAANTAIELRKDAFTLTPSKTTWADFRRQKRRHLSIGKLYKTHHKFWLALYNITLMGFYLLWPAFIAISILGICPAYIDEFTMYWLLPAPYAVRWIVDVLVAWGAMRKLGDSKLLWAWPILDLLYAGYLFTSGIRSLFTKPRTWLDYNPQWT